MSVFPIDETTDFRLVPNVRNAFLSGNTSEFERYASEILFFPKEYQRSFKDIPEEQHMVYWTENHLAGILSSEYLIAQKLGIPLNHNRLEIFLKSRVKYGSSEYLSVAYQAYTLAGLLNVYDFADSLELRDLAKQVIDDIIMSYTYVVHPFTGKFASAGGRLYSYMRTTTDNLKISPLLYLLVGKSIERFNRTSYTLANALLTTTYTIPSKAYDIIEERRKPGIHEYKIRLTKNIPSISNDPIWILWTYGVYLSPFRIHQTIYFIYKYGLYDHHHFSKALSGLKLHSGLARFFVYLFLTIFYGIITPFISFLGKSSWLTDAKLHTVTITKENKSVCVITSITSDASGYKAAQQFPAQILIDSETYYTTFGKIESGVKKELSSMSVLPYTNITHKDSKVFLNVYFGSYNPFFRWLSKNDELTIHKNESGDNNGNFKINIIEQTKTKVKIQIE